MKKLLIGALMALAATSAMAVTASFGKSGKTATVVQPVKVIGEVIETTDLTLVVTPEDSASVGGNDLVFDLGKMYVKGPVVTKHGKIDIALIKGTDKKEFTEKPTVTLSKLDGTNLSVTGNVKSVTPDNLTATVNDVTTSLPITYQLDTSELKAGVADQKVEVTVSGNPKTATKGSVNQREVGVKVVVANQANPVSPGV